MDAPLRNRLIAAFLAATVLPLAATIWITTSLLDRSLGYATTGELDRLSRTLEATVRQFYQREREALKQDALAGRATPTTYAVAESAGWPDAVRAFWDSGEPERFGSVRIRRRSRGLPAAQRRQAMPPRRRDLQPRSARHPDGAAVGRVPADARSSSNRSRDATCGAGSR